MGKRHYGIKGFTKAFLAAIDIDPSKHEAMGGVFRFGVEGKKFKEALHLLPQSVLESQQNESPTVQDLADLAAEKGAWLECYAVVPSRDDERISVEGIVFTNVERPAEPKRRSSLLRIAEDLGIEDLVDTADEVGFYGNWLGIPDGFRLWWD